MVSRPMNYSRVIYINYNYHIVIKHMCNQWSHDVSIFSTRFSEVVMVIPCPSPSWRSFRDNKFVLMRILSTGQNFRRPFPLRCRGEPMSKVTN